MKLNSNAVSVQSNLGCGTLRLLYLTVSSAVYVTLSQKLTEKRKTPINIYVYIYIVHHLRGQYHSPKSRKLLTCHQ